MVNRYASLDVGTNTILMLIAEHEPDGNIKVIRDEHSIARLGEGIGSTGEKRITQAAIDRANDILNRYRIICKELNVTKVYAVGTSALRDAVNSKDVRNELASVFDSEIHIISGEDEAKYSFMGAVDDGRKAIVIDIGGGSTEIIKGENSVIEERKSLQIGAVRLTEKFLTKQPVSVGELKEAEECIDEHLKLIDFIAGDSEIYAVAGTPTTLAGVALGLNAYERDRVDGYKLTLNTIKYIFDEFNKVTTKDIVEIYGVHPDRADIITAGTLILIKALEKIKAGHCIASTKGLRYGIMKAILKHVR